MPNVPGRSKGCNTCRRRKKGCDLRKPSCRRCESDGRVCEGYDRPTIFVEYKPEEKTDTFPSFPNSAASTGSIDIVHGTKQAPPSQLLNLTAWRVELCKSDSELRILDNFLMQVYLPLPAVVPATTKIDNSWSEQWRNVVADMSLDHGIVRHTVAALGLTCLGEQVQDKQMVNHGMKLYGAVLNELNRTLRERPFESCNSNILAAIQLMGLYEQFNGFSTSESRRQSRNWQAHILGIRRLLELAGPDAFKEERAFHIFQACQNGQFTAAFAARKGTSLALRKWRTIPWTGREKSARDLFFDIAFKIPSILEQTEVLDTMSPDYQILNLLHRLHEVLGQLEIWKCMVGMGSPADTWQIENNLNPTGLREPATYQTSDLQTAIMFASVVVHTTVVMHRITELLSTEQCALESITLPNATPYAFWIASAIPHITHEGGIIGSQSVLFPMGAVRWYISNIAQKSPGVAQSLTASLRDAVQELGYMRFMEGFLQGIPNIRLLEER